MGVTRIPVLTAEVVETDPTALKIVNNLSDLPNVDAARSNIGHFAGPSAVVGPLGDVDITHTSVQQAHDDLAATGGLVEIRPGTYTEDLVLTSPNVHYRGHASHGGTTVVGACTISIGVNPGDAATSHQIEMENIIFTPAAAQVDPVVTVSGNPARTWMRHVRIWGSDEACDALSVDIPDGQVALDGCHVWHSAGGTGTPLAVSNGTVRVGPNCAFEHPSGGYAIELSGTGAVWGTATDTLLTGRVQNVGAGNGSFAAYFPGLTVTAPDDPVFTSNGAGAIVLGLLAVTAPTGGQVVAEGVGGFVWSPDSTALTLAANPTAAGHLDPAATLNAGFGPFAARTRGYQMTRQVTAGGAGGQVLTADGLGSYAWGDAGGGGGGSQKTVLRQNANWFANSSAATTVPFDTIVADPLGGWSTINNEFTVPAGQDGVYVFYVNMVLAISGASKRGLWTLEKSDGIGGWDEVSRGEGDNLYARAFATRLMYSLAEGDVVRVRWTDQSGTGTNVVATSAGGSWYQFMIIEKLT